ncbi:MAG: hypothetical protein A2Z99_16140 [Treponema sp. GWB1_62_6]|nr:MAG: hypothetical protein A2Z99_16140 [Treponema sp. GWB1_62_6]
MFFARPFHFPLALECFLLGLVAIVLNLDDVVRRQAQDFKLVGVNLVFLAGKFPAVGKKVGPLIPQFEDIGIRTHWANLGIPARLFGAACGLAPSPVKVIGMAPEGVRLLGKEPNLGFLAGLEPAFPENATQFVALEPILVLGHGSAEPVQAGIKVIVFFLVLVDFVVYVGVFGRVIAHFWSSPFLCGCGC